MEATTMSSIIESVSKLVTASIGWVGDFLTEITANPVLTLFCIAVPLVGMGVGLLKRLIGVRG